MDNEIWKPIDGCEVYYCISNLGNVMSVDRFVKCRNGRVKHFLGKLKHLRTDKDGYKCVSLWKNSKSYNKRIHRLVAEAFISNPNNYDVINHKDEIKDNNCAANLEWCTVDYNNRYGSKTKNTRKQINQSALDGNFIKTWDSLLSAAKYYNCSRSNLTEVCKGRQRTCKGFIWKYEGNEGEI